MQNGALEMRGTGHRGEGGGGQDLGNLGLSWRVELEFLLQKS
jgi:hypothetical protein